MNLAELFIALGIKIEGMDNLAALETLLRNVTEQARAARDAIVGLNGARVAAPGETPSNAAGTAATTPIVGAPTATAGVGTPAPVIPSTPQFGAYLKATDAASKQTLKWYEGVKKLSIELKKVAVVVGLVAAAVTVFVMKAVAATLEMANFGLATGLSTQKLQEFEHAAAMGGSSAKAMLGLVDSLQLKQAQIALGEGDLSPFAFFGIDPNQDTFGIIKELGVRLKDFSEEQMGVVREMAGRMGVSAEMVAALKRNADGLSEAFILSKDAQNSTVALNAAWQDLSFKIAALRNQLVADLAPAFTMIVAIISAILKPLAVMIKWLNSGTVAAQIFRGILIGLAIIFGVVLVAVGLLAAALSAYVVAMGISAAVTSGLAASLLSLGAAWAIGFWPVTVVLGLLAAIVLLIDEVWTALQGGQTLFRGVGEAIGGFIAGPILAIIDAFDWLKNTVSQVWDGMVDTVAEAISAITALIPNWLLKWIMGGSDVSVDPLNTITQSAAQPPSNQSNASIANQNNDVTINVDGSEDPQATAKAVNGGLGRALAQAAYQMPSASW